MTHPPRLWRLPNSRLRQVVPTDARTCIGCCNAPSVSQVPGTLLYWATKEGKVLYDIVAIPAGRHLESLPVLVGSVPSD